MTESSVYPSKLGSIRIISLQIVVCGPTFVRNFLHISIDYFKLLRIVICFGYSCRYFLQGFVSSFSGVREIDRCLRYIFIFCNTSLLVFLDFPDYLISNFIEETFLSGMTMCLEDFLNIQLKFLSFSPFYLMLS